MFCGVGDMMCYVVFLYDKHVVSNTFDSFALILLAPFLLRVLRRLCCVGDMMRFTVLVI